MERRRQFIAGLILSTFLAGFFTVFMSLWRVVPHSTIGQWSLRTQYALTSTSSLDGLLRHYHRVLDNGYSPALHPFLVSRLRDGGRPSEERAAILRFYGLRAERSRAGRELFTLGAAHIGEVLAATAGTDASVRRGAIFLMEGLHRGRELYKPVLFAESEEGEPGPGQDELAVRAYLAYHDWWSLPADERVRRAPLDGTGIAIGEP